MSLEKNVLNLCNKSPLNVVYQLSQKAIGAISNDTGPAHMAAHLNAKWISLFGSHKSAFLQSIERDNFKAIQVSDLSNLGAEKVFERLIKSLS